MRQFWLGLSCVSVLLWGCLSDTAQPQTDDGPRGNTPQAGTATIRPQWKVGDQWIVETATRSLQARSRNADSGDDLVRTRWKFTVAKQEKLGGRDVLRIDIRCLDRRARQPGAMIWAG